MVEKFVFWLKSIYFFEPPPDEINCLLFVVKKVGHYVFLQLCGFEKQPNINENFYRPQEAEFFYSKELVGINEIVFEHRVKSLIYDAFADMEIKQKYCGLKIYLLNNNSIEYLLKIKK